MRPPGRGFTLIELLVVITIIGILIALLFPAMGAIWNSVREYQCQRNLQQLATVISAYSQQYDGSFPFVGVLPWASQAKPSANDWLYIRDRPTSGVSGNLAQGVLVRNKMVGKTDIFYCPLDSDGGLVRTSSSARLTKVDQIATNKPVTSYVINASITYGNQVFTTTMFKDGMRHCRRLGDFDTNDFMLIEESENSSFDAAFMIPDKSKYDITARHRGGGFVACMDGHVEWWNPTDFKAEMDKAYAGSPWYTTTGTRWNPQ
jgi:prepilin-type N-terminal cleavage/methylation domain-containing protein